jgi:hypothetical protein
MVQKKELSNWQAELNLLVQSNVMKMDFDPSFNPVADMTDAMKVMDKLAESGYRFLVKQCGIHDGGVRDGLAATEDYFANITIDDETRLGGVKETYKSYASTPSEALCHSAVMAVGGFL